MSLRTTVLGQMSEIRELHAADRRRQAVISEMLKADQRRSAEMRELRTADHTRQQQLIQTLTVMQSLQGQGQQGPAGGPAQPELPEEAGSKGEKEKWHKTSILGSMFDKVVSLPLRQHVMQIGMAMTATLRERVSEGLNALLETIIRAGKPCKRCEMGTKTNGNKKVNTIACEKDKADEQKGTFWKTTSRNNQNQQQQNKRQNTGRAYTAGTGEKKPYGGSKPLCAKCNYHHDGPCAPKCHKCKQ
ncbi:hypothetical protein Tco_0383445 [Tanacetum coccineum]